jgi:hypothetical protein
MLHIGTLPFRMRRPIYRRCRKIRRRTGGSGARRRGREPARGVSPPRSGTGERRALRRFTTWEMSKGQTLRPVKLRALKAQAEDARPDRGHLSASCSICCVTGKELKRARWRRRLRSGARGQQGSLRLPPSPSPWGRHKYLLPHSRNSGDARRIIGEPATIESVISRKGKDISRGAINPHPGVDLECVPLDSCL